MEWELKSKLLGFEELKGSHSGANVAVKIVEVLDQYGIRDKVNLVSLLFTLIINLFLSWDGPLLIMLLPTTRHCVFSSVPCPIQSPSGVLAIVV